MQSGRNCIFIARHHAAHCYGLSVRPSVCPSDAGIESKRMDIVKYFDDLVEASF